MDLGTWVDAERGRQTLLAVRLGVPAQLVWQWSRRVRPIPIARAPAIEALTDNAVMRWDSRPDDWHELWPELIGAPGAPPVPGTATAATPTRPAPEPPDRGARSKAPADAPTAAAPPAPATAPRDRRHEQRRHPELRPEPDERLVVSFPERRHAGRRHANGDAAPDRPSNRADKWR